jgi:hypothetical protein
MTTCNSECTALSGAADRCDPTRGRQLKPKASLLHEQFSRDCSTLPQYLLFMKAQRISVSTACRTFTDDVAADGDASRSYSTYYVCAQIGHTNLQGF